MTVEATLPIRPILFFLSSCYKSEVTFIQQRTEEKVSLALPSAGSQMTLLTKYPPTRTLAPSYYLLNKFLFFLNWLYFLYLACNCGIRTDKIILTNTDVIMEKLIIQFKCRIGGKYVRKTTTKKTLNTSQRGFNTES